jgi:hypothetical protein
MHRILLLGCGGTAAQNFVKSLWMVGNDYIVGTDSNKYQLNASNVDKQILLPHTKYFTENLLQIIEQEKIEFVHAQPDILVKRLSQRREQIIGAGAKLFLPNDTTLAICQNKMTTNQILQDKGIPVAFSFDTITPEHIPTVIRNIQAISNREKVWVRLKEGAGSWGVIPVTTSKQAIDWVQYWIDVKQVWVTDFMFCEYLPGRDFAFQSLWYEGELLTSAVRERLEYVFGHLTISGQSSSPSVAKSVHDERVNEIAVRAIRAVDPMPHGIYCVDLKENYRDIPCVTEINAGRFFTTSDFFSTIGCNMPKFYVEIGCGEIFSKDTMMAFNAVSENYYWIRKMDSEPFLLKDEKI